MSGATEPRISAVIGRPKGSKNKPDHRAGGLRQGSGPKKKNPSEPSGSRNAQEAPERQPPATVWTRASISRGNGNPNLYDMFKPKLGQNTSSTTENLDTPMSESGVPNNSAAKHVDTDLNDDSEADSDFEDLLEESIPSEPLPNEATVDTSGAISIYLAGIKARLVAELNGNAWPKCYREGSFWIHPPAPFFALQEKDLKPTGLYYPSVFIWFPHLFKLGSTLTCPNRGCAHFQSTHRPLEIKGFNDKPLARRVIGLDRVYYVLTMRIQCKKKNQTGCGGSWNLYDPLILEQLDRGLADCFPAFLTARSGIDKTLMTLIRAGIAHRLSASAWSKILRELHVREHDLRELQYLYAIHREKKIHKNLDIAEKSYEPFSAFDDKSKYAGFYPSRWYINNVYMDYMQHIRPILDQCMALLTAFIIKWDHSFKVPKYLMKLNGVMTFVALFTIFE
ncbi:hypothetical protein FB451DRAFT_1373562 [Mycena latifolia]|nr:hypothetical protein FB451DRAFT_1373562 [Mycena latifolia]